MDANVRQEARNAVLLEDYVDEVPGVVRAVEMCWAADRGRGMVASRDIKKGDVFLRVPDGVMFRVREAEGEGDDEEGTGAKVSTAADAATPTATPDTDGPSAAAFSGSSANLYTLARQLLRAAKAPDTHKLTSTWIGMLPKKFHVIVTWSKASIQQLGTPLRIKMAEQLQKELQVGYAEFCKVSPDVSYEDYCWALCVIQTRGFSYRRSEVTLIPYADMFNHSPEGNDGFQLTKNADAFIFTADRDYKKGEEILLKYNASGGWDQMASYGFLDQGGCNATFPFHVPRVPAELLAATHPSDLDLFKTKVLDDNSGDYHLTMRGPTKATLNALRLRYLSHSDPVHYAQLRDGQVSLENEYHCWLYVYTFCRGALRSFMFSAADDERGGAGGEDDADALGPDGEPHADHVNEALAVAVRTTDRLILKTVKEIARRRYTQLAREMLLLQQQDDPNEEAVRGAQRLAKEVQLMKSLSQKAG